MGTIDKIKAKVLVDMKAKDGFSVKTLRSIISESTNIAISHSRKEVSEDDVLLAISRGIKQREDSRDTYKSVGREDLADIEQKERDIIASFLPEQMSEDELRDTITKVIADTGANSPKQMGMVMGKLMPLVKGKADSKLVSSIVTSLLKN